MKRRVSLVFGHLLFAVLFCCAARSQTVTNLAITGDSANRIDMVILGDGYTLSEMGKFAADVDTVLNTYFAQQPHAEYRNYYNVRRIDVASTDSGVSHPELGITKNTAFGSYFNCGGIERLICANSNAVYTAAGVLPADQQDLIMLIVNDTTYGGSGGSFLIFSMHASAPEIALHELGHTLAHLADEYTSQPPNCSDTMEPLQANATKKTDRTLVKWAPWIDASTPVPTTTTADGVPGIYEGSMYCPTTLYRPTFNSKMRSLGRPYEQINTEQIVLSFYRLVSPIDSFSPFQSAPTVLRGQTVPFSVATPVPATHALNETWYIDGQEQVGISGTSVKLNTGTLAVGVHAIAVTVSDPTPLVRIPTLLLQDSVTWNLNVVDSLYRPTRLPRPAASSTPASAMKTESVMTLPVPRLSPLFVAPAPSPRGSDCAVSGREAQENAILSLGNPNDSESCRRFADR